MVRISGLASGMDIDSIVSDMMKIKRMPLDKLNQQKQTLEWQRDDYREMNTLLDSLDRTIFDNVFLQKNFIAKKVTSSNDSAVSATAISANANVSNSIEVVSLAEPASWRTTKDINEVSLSLSGVESLEFNVVYPGEKESRPVSIPISENDTLDTILSKINDSELGISTMKIKDYTTEGEKLLETGETHIVFTSNKTGEGGSITPGEDATTFLNALGFNLTDDGQLTSEEATVPGKDAQVKINGFITKQSSNNFTLNGIEYTLKAEGKSNISTTTDVDTVFNSIKTFVDKYNEVLEKVQGKLKEERFRSYHPLSDEEQEAMTDRQVEKWEEKARSGLLRNDSILSRALNTMRMDLYSNVKVGENTSYHLSQIGIKTSTNYLEGGKLILDEAKLKEAISKDPNAVYQLFSNSGETHETKGLVRRLRDSLKSSMENLVEKAGSSTKTNNQFTIGKLLNNVTKQIDRYETKMIDLENRYYRQFSAMEKMIQQANSQSMSLMSYFS